MKNNAYNNILILLFFSFNIVVCFWFKTKSTHVFVFFISIIIKSAFYVMLYRIFFAYSDEADLVKMKSIQKIFRYRT